MAEAVGDVAAVVGVLRRMVVVVTGRVDDVVTGAVVVVATGGSVVVVDGTGRVVAVVTVGGSFPRLRTERAASSGAGLHATAAPAPKADTTARTIIRRQRRAVLGGEGSNTVHP